MSEGLFDDPEPPDEEFWDNPHYGGGETYEVSTNRDSVWTLAFSGGDIEEAEQVFDEICQHLPRFCGIKIAKVVKERWRR